MRKDSKILVLGSDGMVGSAICRELENQNYRNILTPKRDELNLFQQNEVLSYFEKEGAKYVFMAAAKVGGILANDTYRADFIWENLSIQNNVFEAAHRFKVNKLLFLGSSCIYPKNCPQPIKEEYLLTGPLEPTNEPYALAKIVGLKMAENFRRQYGHNFFSVMPTNLYGENDNYDEKSSHVLPGLIARIDRAIKEKKSTFEVWGTGNPKREFLYVDDLAEACVFLMQQEQEVPDYVNIGTGEDISIKDLAQMIATKLNFRGKLIFNTDYPDGTMRKVLDISLIKSIGWKPKMELDTGIDKAIQFYKNSLRKKGCYRKTVSRDSVLILSMSSIHAETK